MWTEFYAREIDLSLTVEFIVLNDLCITYDVVSTLLAFCLQNQTEKSQLFIKSWVMCVCALPVVFISQHDSVK